MFLSYRDPLFGIIVFFIFIFVISAATYLFGLYKERKARREYRKLLKRFELGSLKEDDYIHLYRTYNLPFDSILLLASSFLHKGDYNKAISVYLALLNVVESQVQKEELLELLGTTYFKGGFLQRSKDIFLKILKFSPRNINALNHLLIIYEKLNDYDGANDVIDVLGELSKVTSKEKLYIQTLKIISHPTNTFEQNSESLLKVLDQDNNIQRIVAQYLLKYNHIEFWNNIERFDIKKIIDLLWYQKLEDINFDKVNKNQFLQELYTAKGYIQNSTQSTVFELNILINLLKTNDQIADLTFTFSCSKCKKVHPVHELRCPSCNSILTLIPSTRITKKLSTNLASLM